LRDTPRVDSMNRSGRPPRSRLQPDAGQDPLVRHNAPTTPAAQETLATLLVGEREHRLYLLKTEKIDYIESQGNYVKFQSGGIEYISRDSLKRLAPALSPGGFIRIERSLMINIRAIQYAQRTGRGTYAFTLLSGRVLHSGARYREEILRVLPLAHSPHRAAVRSS
jgi:two-component system LytT family response regulator